MIDRICALIGVYSDPSLFAVRMNLVRAGAAYLDHESTQMHFDMQRCRQALIEALESTPEPHRKTATEQIQPLIDAAGSH